MKHKSSDSEETGPEEPIKKTTLPKTKIISQSTTSEMTVTFKQRRLRRCKSVSRAEEIVTEDEKQRRAQPDKP